MWNALGHLIPIAAAGALSTVPITATILLLLSPNQRRSTLPFVIGYVVGIAVMAVVFSLLAEVLPLLPNRQPQAAVGTAEIVVGAGMLVLAVVQWRRRPRDRAAAEPRWLKAVGSLGPWSSLGFGLALCLRPKSILLSIAAGLAVRGGDLNAGEAAIAIAVYTLISASTVIVLTAMALLSVQRTRTWLERTRAWMALNGAIITVAILALIGLVVIGNGITRLG
jgi:hypothetical protein